MFCLEKLTLSPTSPTTAGFSLQTTNDESRFNGIQIGSLNFPPVNTCCSLEFSPFCHFRFSKHRTTKCKKWLEKKTEY